MKIYLGFSTGGYTDILYDICGQFNGGILFSYFVIVDKSIGYGTDKEFSRALTFTKLSK